MDLPGAEVDEVIFPQSQVRPMGLRRGISALYVQANIRLGALIIHLDLA